MSQNDDARDTGKKVFIRSFGCQMNAYDADKMVDVMQAAEGYTPTDDVEQADLILFNTCSVREKAQEKVFSDLGRVKHLKKKGVLIGVGGCVASQEGAAILERAPYVDVVFGPQTLHRLPQLLAAHRAAAPPGGHQLPRDREVRPPAAGAHRRRQRLRVHHGRLQQVLQLLRGALHPRRRGEQATGRRAGGSGRAG
jgi:tRNA A37 methylthiotransferase MiaB